jgi:hypothetical protein
MSHFLEGKRKEKTGLPALSGNADKISHFLCDTDPLRPALNPADRVQKVFAWGKRFKLTASDEMIYEMILSFNFLENWEFFLQFFINYVWVGFLWIFSYKKQRPKLHEAYKYVKSKLVSLAIHVFFLTLKVGHIIKALD